MDGKVCMVTGGSAGIGKAVALKLARLGATVVIVCRNRDRGEAALAEIKANSGNKAVDLMLADLSSQAAIRQLAHNFTDGYQQLHVLVNNAGIIPRKRSLTEDGIETAFAVNHLAYFLLTHLLLDVLKVSAPARIINVASGFHGETIDFDNLQGEKSYRELEPYGQTKLANILFTYELARRLQGTGVTVNCLSPEVDITTRLLFDFYLVQLQTGSFMAVLKFVNFMRKSIGRFIRSSVVGQPTTAGRTVVYLASSPEVEGVTGKYFVNCRETRSAEISYDEETARKLWHISLELTKLNRSYNGCTSK